ncbi:hypothetical protein [Actinotalea solisilvae]|uniref:hypothetical protein n=1 Tax=Actinotalea solisilvae TaxID=2072922 RepID=UPI0018F18AB0|nr:hypothetical protein [Actinotalea solisilvae]
MKRFWRTAAVLLLALIGGVGVAGSATASVANGCTDDGGYWAQGVCGLTVEATPTCTGTGTPRLEYVATPTGTSSTTLTLTWVNPTGPDVVQTGLPLSGAVDWPSGAWADRSLEIVFAVNPTSAVTVEHPSGVGCSSVLASSLSGTGSETTPLIAGAAALVGLGLAAVLVTRRRSAATA